MGGRADTGSKIPQGRDTKQGMYGIAAESFFTYNVVKASSTPLSVPKEMGVLFALNCSAIIISTRLVWCPVRESQLTL